MIINALEAIKTLEKLNTELSGVKQGIKFFKSSDYFRLKKILEEEEKSIQAQIKKLYDVLSNTNLRIK